MASKNTVKSTPTLKGAKPAAQAIVSQTAANAKAKTKAAKTRKAATMC